MSYATLAVFKAWDDISDSNSDTQIQTVLDAATRSIDRLCGRSFALSSEARYFYSTDGQSVDVVDLINPTEVAVDINGTRTYSTVLTAAQYELLPYQGEDSVEGTRFQRVKIWPTSSVAFTPGRLVRITGTWGYVDGIATPPDIILACNILAARLWKRRESPFGVTSVSDLGTMAQIRKTDPDLANLLEPYVRETSWVVV